MSLIGPYTALGLDTTRMNEAEKSRAITSAECAQADKRIPTIPDQPAASSARWDASQARAQQHPDDLPLAWLTGPAPAPRGET